MAAQFWTGSESVPVVSMTNKFPKLSCRGNFSVFYLLVQSSFTMNLF